MRLPSIPIALSTVIFLFGAGVTGASEINKKATSCDVEVVLKPVDTGMYSYVLDGYGELQEDFDLLVPANIEEGTYSISVTHKSSNFYKVDNENLYIKTTVCYEYEYYADAILQVVNYSDISSGELTFK